MTLPTTTTLNSCDDDSDMFGPPRSTPIGYYHHRSRVPMITPRLRQREERKRILQLCAHKLERIKDSETNLRRSVCINNTYCRLTDELRREKQSRYLANQPKSETKPETARENIFNPYNSCGIDSSSHQPSNKTQTHNESAALNNNNNCSNNNNNNANISSYVAAPCHIASILANAANSNGAGAAVNMSSSNACAIAAEHHAYSHDDGGKYSHHIQHHNSQNNNHNSSIGCHQTTTVNAAMRKRHLSSANLDNDLEILDRELNAINAPMPLIDPEITQGAEQLEKAISLRKRARSEDESDRLVREALSQFYIPPQRLISAIEDCPLDVVMSGVGNDLELDFDMNPNQKEFEVIMDALRLGTPSPTSSMAAGIDSCGQAAMMSESASVFHNLVVTSLET